MNIRYDREEDILTYEVSPDEIDYAEELDSIVVHFTKEGKPVLLEILGASDFIAQTTKAAITA